MCIHLKGPEHFVLPRCPCQPCSLIVFDELLFVRIARLLLLVPFVLRVSQLVVRLLSGVCFSCMSGEQHLTRSIFFFKLLHRNDFRFRVFPQCWRVLLQPFAHCLRSILQHYWRRRPPAGACTVMGGKRGSQAAANAEAKAVAVGSQGGRGRGRGRGRNAAAVAPAPSAAGAVAAPAAAAAAAAEAAAAAAPAQEPAPEAAAAPAGGAPEAAAAAAAEAAAATAAAAAAAAEAAAAAPAGGAAVEAASKTVRLQTAGSSDSSTCAWPQAAAAAALAPGRSILHWAKKVPMAAPDEFGVGSAAAAAAISRTVDCDQKLDIDGVVDIEAIGEEAETHKDADIGQDAGIDVSDGADNEEVLGTRTPTGDLGDVVSDCAFDDLLSELGHIIVDSGMLPDCQDRSDVEDPPTGTSPPPSQPVTGINRTLKRKRSDVYLDMLSDEESSSSGFGGVGAQEASRAEPGDDDDIGDDQVVIRHAKEARPGSELSYLLVLDFCIPGFAVCAFCILGILGRRFLHSW